MKFNILCFFGYLCINEIVVFLIFDCYLYFLVVLFDFGKEDLRNKELYGKSLCIF